MNTGGERMIQELLNFFKQYDSDQLVADVYEPGPGLYLRINEDQTIDTLLIDKDTVKGDLFEWFAQVEYKSKLLTMNKSQDPKKKIHSNNYYSVFAKNDILPLPSIESYNSILAEWEESIQRYFQTFLKPKKENILDSYMLPPINEKKVEQHQKYMLENWNSIEKLISKQELSKNTYVKIFFSASLADYHIEYQRYVLPKIFNKNDFNIQIDEKILGLSNYNMGMNAKKPYLELMSTSFRVPFRTSLDDAMIIKNIFEWLNNQRDADKENRNINTVYIPNDFTFKTQSNKADRGMYVYFHRGQQEPEIKDFEFLPTRPSENFDFTIKNYLEVEEGIDQNFNDRILLEKEVNHSWFNGQLITSYYADSGDLPKIKTGVVSKNLVNLIITSRESVLSFFRKGNERPLKDSIEKIGLQLIQEQISLSSGLYLGKVRKAYNLWLSFLEYFNKGGNGEMADRIYDLREGLKEKLAADEMPICQTEEEFYFIAGQLTYYLLSQSASHRKDHSALEPFLRVKKGEMLKGKLQIVYVAYGHAIYFNHKAFKRALAMVMGYKVESDVKKYMDIYLAGVLSDNVLYMSKEKEKKDEQEGIVL